MVIIIVAAYAGFLIFVTWPIAELSIEKAALFGDGFGIVTSLFSGLAFSGLIITILLQRNELSLQREELTLTRLELEKSGNAQAEQVAELKKAAELNALCTLAQSYTDMSLEPNSAKSTPAKESVVNRDALLKKLKERVEV
ncbi:MAG: hypothetical protein ACJAWL_001040 [Motiliproteus sp.]|jgi:hypothetical protein